ncbi:MAG: hypothetical protein JWM68_2883 [Verrucomicrobiales bacterium]|nr:hypothetical protein [Verrucomicrobiales bacterium]
MFTLPMEMIPYSRRSLSLQITFYGCFLALLLVLTDSGRAQSIPNPSFEANTFTNYPGYASTNGGSISGWTISDSSRVGLNPAGSNPFADNGAIPNGTNVAFIQGNGAVNTLSTTITGLTANRTYMVTFRANQRSSYGPPACSWSLKGGAFVPFTAAPAVGGSNPYYTNSGTFTATLSATAALALRNTSADDTAVLLDDFSIVAVPRPVTMPATSLTLTTATLNGTVLPGNSISNYFEYGTTTNYGNVTPRDSISGNETDYNIAVSAAINGLLAGTLYHFRLVVSNSTSIEKGADLTFTLPAVSAVMTQPATDVTVTTATLNAMVNAGGVASYNFQYGTTTNYGNVTEINLTASTNNVTVSTGISVLPGTLYHFRIVINNSVGTNAGTDVTFITPSLVPAIFNPSFEFDTFTNAPGYASGNGGTITGWAISNPARIGLNPAGGSLFANNGATPDGTNVAFIQSNGQTNILSTIITGLAVNRTYKVTFRANQRSSGVTFDRREPICSWSLNGGAFVAFTASLEVNSNPYYTNSNTFVASAITAPLSLQNATSYDSAVLLDNFSITAVSRTVTQPATGVTVTNAILNGTVNAGDATDYYFQYGTTTNYGNIATGSSVAAGTNKTSVSATISGLTTGTIYHFRLVTTNSNSFETGADFTFTPARIPAAVTQPATSVTPTTATLNGTVNAGGVTGYYFQYGTTTNYGSFTTVSSLPASTNDFAVSAAINGLSPGILYYFRLVATNSFGSNAGASISFVTEPSIPTVVTLPATGVSNTVAQLNGTINPNASATTYYFQYGVNLNYGSFTPGIAVGSGVSSLDVNASLSGLTPGLTYHARLVASNGVGIVSGRDIQFGAPALALNGPSVLTNECHVPVTIPGATISGAPLAIAAGDFHSLLLKSDRTVVAWGANDYGQTNVPVGLTNVVAIAAGKNHSLALKEDGTIVAWGANNLGQTQVPVALGYAVVTAIAAGGDHCMALKSDGTVTVWGYNSFYEIDRLPDLHNVVAITAGNFHFLALKNNGTVDGWGGLSFEPFFPTDLSNVVAIAAGNYHSLALKSDGTVTQFGDYFHSINAPPAGLTDVAAIAASGSHSMALKSDGTIIAWESSGFGATTVPAGLSNVVAIAAGNSHFLSLKSDGTITAWGNNFFGQTNIPAGLNILNLTMGTSGTVNFDSPGSYTLTYASTNALGAIATATRTVIVQDTLPPVITLLGSNPLFITNLSNLPFVDPGATALDLCGGAFPITSSNNVNVNFPGAYTIDYHSTDSGGHSSSAIRNVVVTTLPTLVGDQNGDGIVSQSELDAVYANYAPNSPWLYMTNVAGLGGTNVTFSLPNSALGAFSVEYSTNLTDWLQLGSATPRYGFEDTNAPAIPQRFYRLR